MIRHLSLLLVMCVALAACSSGVKDYSKATPLQDISTQLKVKALWLDDTAYLPKYSHRQLTPVTANDVLYYANARGTVVAVKASTGNRLWRTPVDAVLSGGPGVGAGLVIVGTRKAEIIALDITTGKEVWRSRISTEMLSQPKVDDERVVVQASDGRVYALDVKTGNPTWSYSHEIPSLTLRGTASPLVVGDRVLAGFADGKLVSLNSTTGELQWETTVAVSRGRTDLERLVDIDGLFGVTGDVVYVSTYQGKVAAISLDNGNIIWSREISSYTGLSLFDNKLFISDSGGHVWCLDQRTGETLWRQDDLAARETTLPVVVGGAVVVADFDGYIHWLAMDDGHFIARQKLQDIWLHNNLTVYDRDDHASEHRNVNTPPVVDGDRVYVRDRFGALAALQPRSAITGN